VESQTGPASVGSRTAAYVVAGALATVPALAVMVGYFGPYVGMGGVVTLWTIGVVWLLKKREDDPTWDRRPTSGRR
jgi:hypothetical protein